MVKKNSSSTPSPQPDWLLPISSEEPCGPSLEYDPEYAILMSHLAQRGEAQYGSFVDVPEAPNWVEIERDCRRLLLRTKDIHLFVWLCRARTRLAQAEGLAQALSMLATALRTWPEAIHPQLVIEGQLDPEVRANAIAELADMQGLLADVREIAVSNTALRLTVRDVERAFAVPRAVDASSPESVSLQLDALRAAGDDAAPVRLLAQAARSMHEIADWSRQRLGNDAPSLAGLLRVLDLFAEPWVGQPSELRAQQPGESGIEQKNQLAPESSGASLEPARTGGHARHDVTRDEVLLSIRAAREWFEAHEPSSPVAVLLRQSERMVGKRFSQVADSIPLDLLRRWEADDQTAPGDAAP